MHWGADSHPQGAACRPVPYCGVLSGAGPRGPVLQVLSTQLQQKHLAVSLPSGKPAGFSSLQGKRRTKIHPNLQLFLHFFFLRGLLMLEKGVRKIRV